jgi:glyoxylase-like metal-dependent hydrolase (beta-lactamase superfamily II)
VFEWTAINLGGTEIQIRFLGRAHTGGDLSVYLPTEKILFMSEAFMNRIFPAMRSAYPSEWVKTIEAAQKFDVTTFVPGHGFVDSTCRSQGRARDIPEGHRPGDYGGQAVEGRGPGC